MYITNEAVGYYQLKSGKSEKNNCFSKFSSNSLDFIGWNLRKSWHFLYWRRREKNFSEFQNFSTRNSPSVFPYLVKLNDNGSYHGLREPNRKLENHYQELKIYQIEPSIWDESLLLCNCACSLEYSSLSTLAGLSYHICGKLEVAFKASPSSQHQHCTALMRPRRRSLNVHLPDAFRGLVSCFVSHWWTCGTL